MKVTSGYSAVFLIVTLLGLGACKPPDPPRWIVQGDRVLVRVTKGNEVVYDTFSSQIPAFAFVDQMGDTVSSLQLDGKVYVADFFFTHCPSICPKMKANLIKVAKAYGNRNDFEIISYSIDPERDSVPVLRAYAEKLGIQSTGWHLLTGNRDSIYALADRYLEYAAADPNAAGGFIHDGNFVLIDRNHRIRGYYDGTSDDGVQQLINDLKLVFSEK